MKNILKRICPLIMVFILLFSVIAVNVSAISGTSTIALSSKSPKVGDTLTVTVVYNLDSDRQAVSGTLTYDTSILKYVSANCPANNIGTGVFFTTVGNAKLYYIKIDLEVIAEGQSAISLIDAKCSDVEDYNVKGSSARVITKNAITSSTEQDINSTTKAALTSITVAAGELTPAFNQNITQYKVTVPYSHTDGTLSCESLDRRATITVQGDRQLKVGNNTRVIVVTASNGDTRRYTVVFNRLDENGNDTTVEAPAVTVTVNDKEYTIGQLDASLTPPSGFTLSTIQYGQQEVAAYKNASGKTVLLYLLDADGTGDFFLYEDGKISYFRSVSVGDATYIIKDVTETAPEGMYEATYDLNGKTVSCYRYSDQELSDFVVFSAVSPDGNAGYYSYDETENTIQRIVKLVSQEVSDNVELTVSKSTKIAVISLISIFVVLLITLIIVLVVKAAGKSGKGVRNIFDTDEEEYEMEEASDTPHED